MVNVLVTEDSVVARKLLVNILDGDPQLNVVGEATNGSEAVKLADELKPDVITMDVHMPVMDGLEATRRIMESTPTPIVMVSAADPTDVARSFGALEAGAVSVLAKPRGPGSEDFAERSAELAKTVRTMAGVRVVRRRPRATTVVPPATPQSAAAAPRAEARAERRGMAAAPAAWGKAVGTQRVDVVAIGSSTGGPDALGRVLGGLPADAPVPIVIVQHITLGFHDGLAAWLNTACPLNVRVGAAGERIEPGDVVIAPGGSHMEIGRDRSIKLIEEPPVAGHRPSANYLFKSVAHVYGRHALGVILTGMGDDGATGLVDMKQAGAPVIGQDEETSVVYGMPREAFARGAVDVQLPLQDVAGAIAATWAFGR